MRENVYVFRNWTGRLAWSLAPRDETVAIFRAVEDANAFCEMVNSREGWRRELQVATEQARAA